MAKWLESRKTFDFFIKLWYSVLRKGKIYESV